MHRRPSCERDFKDLSFTCDFLGVVFSCIEDIGRFPLGWLLILSQSISYLHLVKIYQNMPQCNMTWVPAFKASRDACKKLRRHLMPAHVNTAKAFALGFVYYFVGRHQRAVWRYRIEKAVDEDRTKWLLALHTWCHPPCPSGWVFHWSSMNLLVPPKENAIFQMQCLDLKLLPTFSNTHLSTSRGLLEHWHWLRKKFSRNETILTSG